MNELSIYARKGRDKHLEVDPLARQFLEACAQADLRKAQYRVAMAVASHLGGQSKHWDYIGVQQIADFTGLKYRPTLRILHELSEDKRIPFRFKREAWEGCSIHNPLRDEWTALSTVITGG